MYFPLVFPTEEEMQICCFFKTVASFSDGGGEARKALLENKHLRNFDNVSYLLSCLNYTMLANYASTGPRRASLN